MIKAIGAVLMSAVFLAFMAGAGLAQATKPEQPTTTDHPKAAPGKPDHPQGQAKPDHPQGQAKPDHPQGQAKPDHPQGQTQHDHSKHEHPK